MPKHDRNIITPPNGNKDTITTLLSRTGSLLTLSYTPALSHGLAYPHTPRKSDKPTSPPTKSTTTGQSKIHPRTGSLLTLSYPPAPAGSLLTLVCSCLIILVSYTRPSERKIATQKKLIRR